MNVRYRVELSEIERAELATLLRGGRRSAHTLKRAQILLAADAGESEQAIARHVAVSASTVCRTQRRFVEGNLERALSEEPRPGAARLLSGREEALLVATACSKPPMGRSRWTLELLAGEVVRLTGPDSLSRETVRRRLAENDLKPWREKMWCIPRVDGDFVARMEDVLDLYAEQPDPNFPVVCFDESSIQMLGEIREPIAAASGRPRRVDYEYRRHGTMMLFVMVDAHRPWRRVMLSEQRTGLEFALGMRALVDREYPHAPRIRVVLDNLSTHTPAALYQAFPAAEARRILRRREFHSTPKHASWLNVVETEIGVLKGQCLDRRVSDPEVLKAEITAWESARNSAGARIRWMFTTEKARAKMGRAYPQPASPDGSVKPSESL